METQTLAQANTWTQKQTHNHTQRSTLIMKLQRRRVENWPLLRRAWAGWGGGGGDSAWLKQKLQPAGSNVSWPASLISLLEKARFLPVTARHWHSWDVDVRSKSCSLETSPTVMVPLCLLGLIISPPSRHHTPDPRLTGLQNTDLVAWLSLPPD